VSAIPTIPATLVKEQAAHLGRITNNIVGARVKTRTDSDGDFWITFSIVAPALGSYEYKLFALWHGAELYPIRVGGADLLLEDESSLRTFLRDSFASPTTIRVVQSLVAQARAASEDEDDDLPF
jgi:hypothetical protein